MFLPVPIARQNGGGGSMPSAPVAERQIAPIMTLTSSAGLTYADIRNYLDANGASSYGFGEVYIDLILVGGGGSGIAHWNYTKGLFGGFPGQVVRRRMLVSDIWSSPDRDVFVNLGTGGQHTAQGGQYGEDGAPTDFLVWDVNAVDPVLQLTAQGGRAGQHPDVMQSPNVGLFAQKARHEEAVSLGYRGIDVSLFASTGAEFQPPFPIATGNLEGPGIGGFVIPYDPQTLSSGTYWYAGGASNCLDVTARSGGSDADPDSQDGQDGDPTVFGSYGGGGASVVAEPTGDLDIDGGHGGTPGGGGGALFFNGSQDDLDLYPATLRSGRGGDGGAAFRFSVWESAS